MTDLFFKMNGKVTWRKHHDLNFRSIDRYWAVEICENLTSHSSILDNFQFVFEISNEFNLIEVLDSHVIISSGT